MQKEKKVISFSRISTFMRCPYEYKYVYIDRVEGTKRKGTKLGLGITLHAVLKDFYNIKDPADRTVDALLHFLDTNWSSEYFDNSSEESHWFNKGINILNEYYSQNDHAKTPIYIEQKFRAEINGLIFIGIIDRIDKNDDNSFEIIDYKLEDYFDCDIDNLQASFYYLGCKNDLKIEAQKFTYYILETNEKRSLILDPGRIKSDINKINSVLADIDSTKIFIPKINNLCINCGVKLMCPAYKDK